MGRTSIAVNEITKQLLEHAKHALREDNQKMGIFNLPRTMDDAIAEIVMKFMQKREATGVGAASVAARTMPRLIDVPHASIQNDVARSLHELKWDSDDIVTVLLALSAAHEQLRKERRAELEKKVGSLAAMDLHEYE